ncbi:MAG: hypothetical protein FWH11_07735 [Micrococcales bacterium]|nr:hypothetical protein [Micrococcales bacterium]
MSAEVDDRPVRVEIATIVQPSRPELLDPSDLARWQRLRRVGDRDRLSTGVLLRLFVGGTVGLVVNRR